MAEKQEESSVDVVFVGVAGCTSSGKSTLARAILHLMGGDDDDDAPALFHVSPPINLDWFLDRTRMPPQDGESSQDVLNWETPAGVRYDILKEELRRLQEYVRDPNVCRSSSTTTSITYTMNAMNPEKVQLQLCQSNNKRHDGTNKKTSVMAVLVVVEGFLLYYHRAVADLFRVRFWMETPYETALPRRLNRDLPTRMHCPEERREYTTWFDRHIWKYFLEYKDVQLENGQPFCNIHADWTVEEQLTTAQAYLRKELPVLYNDHRHGDKEVASSIREQKRKSRLKEACRQLEAEIAENTVPELIHEHDRQAMDLVQQAEEAEKLGDMNRAVALYRKVRQLSPTVADFLGL